MKLFGKLMILAVGLTLLSGCGEKKQDAGPGAVGEKVTLDFHIMSKCPFGVKVVQAVTPVLEKLGPNVDFNIYYIGKEKDGELTSMHGEEEVKGNIIQLCVREQGDAAAWINFMKCQNEDWRKIPEGWEKCVKAPLDAAKIKACIDGDQGKKLLRDSFKASEAKQATGSPTIFLGGEPYRGGRSEASFGRALCAKFTKEKPAFCKDIPAPVKVPVTVISDKRCTGRSCDAKRFLTFISHTFEGAEVRELDWSDPAAQELFTKTGEKFLPVAIFGADVQKEEEGYNRLKRRLRQIEGAAEFVFPLGRDWDPKSEVCDDGADNTGDGKVDCDDDTCKEKKVCRAEIKNRLDLFVMSQCPYGVRALNAVDEVLKNFKNDKKRIDFEINFIGDEKDGALTSMHGQEEVNENLREICAQKHYNKDYKFMEYVSCRNQDIRNTDWAACAKNGIKADVIKKCSEGEEGKQLLAASYKKAKDLGIAGSPGWLLNNRFDMMSRDPDGIKRDFCAKNQVAGCENTLSATTPGQPLPAGGGCGPVAPAPAAPAAPAPAAPAAPAPVAPAPK